MARGKELSPQIRSCLCELHSIGYSYKHIHEIHREIPLGTIKYTIRKEAVRNNNQSMPRSGAPHKISEQERDQIYDLTNHEPHTKIRELQDEVSTPLTKRTIRRLLREMHKKKWLQRVRPEITENHANQRLAWANQYAHYTLEDWKRVKWSDECSIERGKGIRPIWTFRKPSEQLYMHDIKAKRTGKSVSKMFWLDLDMMSVQNWCH